MQVKRYNSNNSQSQGPSRPSRPYRPVSKENERIRIVAIALCAVAVLIALLAICGVFGHGPSAVKGNGDTTAVTASPDVSTSPGESASPGASVSPGESSTPSQEKSVKPFPLASLSKSKLPLAKGSKSEYVIRLQETLKELGYFSTSTSEYFGPATEKALIAFQKKEKVKADGKLNLTTLNALQKAWNKAAPEAESSASQAPTQSVKAEVMTAADTDKPLAGKVIGIDAGHQKKCNTHLEQNAPGSSAMKKMVSSGTRGIYTRVYEYQLNLNIALKLREKLEDLGAKVVMIRTKNDVNISNRTRALTMNKNKVDAFIRIHANGSNNHSVHGMSMIVTKQNGYQKGALQKKSAKLGKAILAAALKTTGAKNRGMSYRDDETGNNWSKEPVCLIEMGYMTYKAEDKLLQTKSYQEKMVEGIANGFVKYFS